MPRSRSRSIESRNWSRMSRSLTAPVSTRIRSARVDFPWSIWAATTIFRMELGSVTVNVQHTGAFRAVRRPRSPLVQSRAYGKYQVPEEAHPHEREGTPAQSGDRVRIEDDRAQ